MSSPPSRPLSGRTALVTGVSRRGGIGFAVAARLISLGAVTFVHSWRPHDEAPSWGSDPESPGDLAESLAPPGGGVGHLSLDLADPPAPSRLVREATDVMGHVDILIANHARSSNQALEDLTADELSLSFNVNSAATLLLIKEWAAHHDDARPGGRAIVMTSGQHLGPMAAEIPYAASKAAVAEMIPAIAAGLAPRGVTVNAVNPGPTDTGWASEEVRRAVLERMPFGRWGTPEDAARVVAWLCTDEAGWITGQVINSEGGFNRWA